MARGATGRLERKLIQLIKRTDELRIVLDQFDETTRVGLEIVQRGVPLVEGLAEARAGSARASLNKALDRLETARRDVRVAMSDVAIEEGASLSEVARALGVSRQLLSRLAASARADKG